MTKNNEPAPSESIAASLTKTSDRIAKLIEQTATACDPTPPQMRLLGWVAAHKGMTMSQAADAMGHSSSAATGLAERLVKIGMLARVPVDGDRRAISLVATNGGLEALRKIDGKIAAYIAVRLKEIDPKHWPTLAKQLAVIAS